MLRGSYVPNIKEPEYQTAFKYKVIRITNKEMVKIMFEAAFRVEINSEKNKLRSRAR